MGHLCFPSPSLMKDEEELTAVSVVNNCLLLHMWWVAPLSTTNVVSFIVLEELSLDLG